MPAGLSRRRFSRARQVALTGRNLLNWPNSHLAGGRFNAPGSETDCIGRRVIPSEVFALSVNASGIPGTATPALIVGREEAACAGGWPTVAWTVSGKLASDLWGAAAGKMWPPGGTVCWR